MKYVSIVYSKKTKQTQKQKMNNLLKKDMINSLFFSYNSRIIQEYFEAKIGRKIRLFSLARKNNILI